MYDLEKKRLVREVVDRRARRVLIQLPDGLKQEGFRLARFLENKAGVEVVVSADPCYGACDVAFSDAEQMRADLIVHYGHTPSVFPAKIPTVYLEARVKEDMTKAIKKALPFLANLRRIGVATTIQHIHELENVKRILKDEGKIVLIGKARGNIKYDGQVLGCDFTAVNSIANEADGFLFVGGGNFHALGIALATGKRVVVADPYLNEAREIENLKRKVLRQRWATICKAKKAQRFGIIIGLKPGQTNLQLVAKVKRELQTRGKRALLICMREITPEKLLAFSEIDAFVNTACPRVAIDDAIQVKKPVLTSDETLIMLGRMPWEAYAKENAPKT